VNRVNSTLETFGLMLPGTTRDALAHPETFRFVTAP
jgi:hypothetical protein